MAKILKEIDESLSKFSFLGVNLHLIKLSPLFALMFGSIYSLSTHSIKIFWIQHFFEYFALFIYIYEKILKLYLIV